MMAARPLPKKLILCCDGTWQNSDNNYKPPTVFPWQPYGSLLVPTNVTRISHAISPYDSKGTPQIVYYQAGIGSSESFVDHMLGGGIASGIGEYMREAYAFLADNYVPGDDIIIIGFSRGAFIARSVAGLIGDMGMLTKAGLTYFYDIFHDWELSGYAQQKSLLAESQTTFHFTRHEKNPFDFSSYRNELRRHGWAVQETVDVTAVAVWDTVGALGMPVNPIFQRLGLPAFIHKYRFYDTKLSPRIRHAFQALAIDEHRAAFSPSVWELPSQSSDAADQQPTHLEQCWFPGVHSNIGGSYDDTGIADLTLAWIMSRLAAFLDFDPDFIEQQHAANASHAAAVSSAVPPHGPATSSTSAAAGAKALWASSTLYDSSSDFITGVLGGSSTRTPGRYHATDPLTNRRIQATPLQHTHERMHRSVRLRKEIGGLVDGGKWSAYSPPALDGWRLQQRKGSLETGKESGEWMWIYEGDEEQFKGRVMEEDSPGVYEALLMRATTAAAAAAADQTNGGASHA